MQGGSGYHLTARLSRVEQSSNTTLFLPKTCRDCTNLVQNSCHVYSLDWRCTRGGMWKGDILVADTEELEQMDASVLYARRLNAMELLTPMKGEKFIFPVADWTVIISGGDQRLRTSTLIWDRPDRGKEQGNLRREPDKVAGTQPQLHRTTENVVKYDTFTRRPFVSSCTLRSTRIPSQSGKGKSTCREHLLSDVWRSNQRNDPTANRSSLTPIHDGRIDVAFVDSTKAIATIGHHNGRKGSCEIVACFCSQRRTHQIQLVLALCHTLFVCTARRESANRQYNQMSVGVMHKRLRNFSHTVQLG